MVLVRHKDGGKGMVGSETAVKLISNRPLTLDKMKSDTKDRASQTKMKAVSPVYPLRFLML
jgi:hypothetical protein